MIFQVHYRDQGNRSLPTQLGDSVSPVSVHHFPESTHTSADSHLIPVIEIPVCL